MATHLRGRHLNKGVKESFIDQQGGRGQSIRHGRDQPPGLDGCQRVCRRNMLEVDRVIVPLRLQHAQGDNQTLVPSKAGLQTPGEEQYNHTKMNLQGADGSHGCLTIPYAR